MPTQKLIKIDQKFLDEIKRVSAPDPEPKKKPSERIKELAMEWKEEYPDDFPSTWWIKGMTSYLDEAQKEESNL